MKLAHFSDKKLTSISKIYHRRSEAAWKDLDIHRKAEKEKREFLSIEPAFVLTWHNKYTFVDHTSLTFTASWSALIHLN